MLTINVGSARVWAGSVELLGSECHVSNVGMIDAECIGLGRVMLTSNRLSVSRIRKSTVSSLPSATILVLQEGLLVVRVKFRVHAMTVSRLFA